MEAILTLLGSTILGGVMTIWSQANKDKQARREFELKIMSGKAEAFKEARAVTDKRFMWTRRVIALTATFSIVLLPKMSAFLGIDVWYPTEFIEKGFWFFTENTSSIKWTKLDGFVITPLDVHLMMAIIGLYFGGSLTKR